MSILIIDDEADIRSTLKLRLQSEGFAVVAVGSVQTAWQQLRQLPVDEVPEIELILMDIMMPELSGIEACRRFKQDPVTADIPVIIMTASHDMEQLREAFAAGAIDYINKPFDKIELLARIGSALRTKSEIDLRKDHERQLVTTTRQLKVLNARLQRLSTLDGLTGLYNRRYFDTALAREYRRARRAQLPISLIMVDIDWFKRFNDRHGHLAGDECLRRVAGAIRAVAHRSHDLCIRYGGEEFAVILPDTPHAGALELAEQLRARMETLELHDGAAPATLNITVSLGVATDIPEHNGKADDLVAAADAALYRSKRQGRNRVSGSPQLR